MITEEQYLENLIYPNDFTKDFALHLKPFVRPFIEGRILCSPSEGWENVFFHCLSEAISVNILCDFIPAFDSKLMVPAAFLHDANKRREAETMSASINDDRLDTFLREENSGKAWLKSLGCPEGIILMLDGFGDRAAQKIFTGEISDLALLALHYVDDITHGDKIVTIEERLSLLEKNPRYSVQNESHRNFFKGKTLYQAKRELGVRAQKLLASEIGLGSHEDLPAFLQSKHEELARNHSYLLR